MSKLSRRSFFEAGMSVFIPWLLTLVGAFFSSPSSSQAVELFRGTGDVKAISNFAEEIDAEYGYRQRIEGEAASWAKELMFMYAWSARHHLNLPKRPSETISKEELSKRFNSELAWLTITGHGVLATFDFVHADQSLVGSTSRLVGALTRSKKFWLEVRNQCLAIEDVKKMNAIQGGPGAEPGGMRDCADRLRRDMNISQIVGSNVSLFVSGGVAIGLGKRLFQRYAAKWVVARVLPILPAFARTKWAATGALAALIVLPAGFVVAGVAEEHETNKAFYENLDSALKENQDESDKASVLRFDALQTEREVLELAIWIGARLPKGSAGQSLDPNASQQFVMAMKLSAPNWIKLQKKQDELEQRRATLEKDLGSIPGVTARLLALVEERKHGSLKSEDADLLRKAQYLASLRLVMKALAAAN